MKKMGNVFYAQSGGVTAVINATACAVIEEARTQRRFMGTVYAGRDGILGALHEELIDTRPESAVAIAKLRHTPGSAFGSCRYKLRDIEQHRVQYERLIEVFRAHNIRFFFYNGGNDSQDTTLKVSHIAGLMNYDLTCIGIPKTIDNDLPHTDTCPGFGSAAKYVAVSTLEAALDVRSMAKSSTRVFILEVMGRHAGWIAAASGLAARAEGDAPHVIVFPEIAFDQQKFLAKVEEAVRRHGYCVVVTSEGARYADGRFLAQASGTDAFGHAQLGGVAPLLAGMVKSELNLKHHYAIADYLQRSARHIASKVDVEHAYAVGATAVKLALKGHNAIMTTIERTAHDPYRWHVGSIPLVKVANKEKKLPRSYISRDGFHITAAARQYLAPLIRGEAPPPFKHGLPDYVTLKNVAVKKKLPLFSAC